MKKVLRHVSVLSILCAAAIARTTSMAANAIGTVVQTKAGKVLGYTAEDGGETVHLYKGIPYVAPLKK